MISGDVTLTVDSDLNGANPQFNLTCISTGGPATTVTWTRDSVTVTEGTETVLDDPVTAQYTHTLTLTRRLGGLYTCTVTNNKPSNDSANFIVQGINLCHWMMYDSSVCCVISLSPFGTFYACEGWRQLALADVVISLPLARMRSEGTVVGSVCLSVCYLTSHFSNVRLSHKRYNLPNRQ